MNNRRRTALGPRAAHGQLRSRLLQLLLLTSLALVAVLSSSGCGGGCTANKPESDSTVYVVEPSVAVQPGGVATFRVIGSGGTVELPLVFRAGSFSCSPASKRLTIPFDQSVQVTVPANTAPGRYTFSVSLSRGTGPLDTAEIVVSEATGGPAFTFTASRRTVSTVPTVFSPPVTFTLTSVNGFAGDVSVNWVEEEGVVSDNPVPKPLVVSLSPTTPRTFTRRFYRFAEHQNPLDVVFTATSGSVVRTVPITVNYGTP